MSGIHESTHLRYCPENRRLSGGHWEDTGWVGPKEPFVSVPFSGLMQGLSTAGHVKRSMVL